MKVALILCCYNRPKYLRECLQSLSKSDLSNVYEVNLFDDGSVDIETRKLITEYNLSHDKTTTSRSEVNQGIKLSLLHLYDFYFSNTSAYDIVINIDSDAIVRYDFINQLLLNYLRGTILTGFHSETKNSNGTDRHKILSENEYTYKKQSVGGINFCIDKEAYNNYVNPALKIAGNWDHNSCINAGEAYCLKESVIEHIGFDSSMNHNEQPDISANFHFHNLSNVTLVCVDGRGGEYINNPISESSKRLKFLNILTIDYPFINSIEKYSEFIIKELYKHIKTSHMLIVQHDGYVINPNEWDDIWLKYDYIGATWWYKDGMNVGNGGFSLRSKKLMEICATDTNIKMHHPEDHHICRTYRSYLESKYGIKFAPEADADNFSYEGYRQPGKRLDNQFGFHGKRNIKKATGIKYVFNQFRGLGDILFLVPMYRALIDEGNEVIWPIVKEYMNICKHFPDINFVDMETVNVPYEIRGAIDTNHGKLIPYRFAIEIMGLTMKDCMKAKYQMYGHDWMMWRELSFKRFIFKEKELAKFVGAAGKYILVNKYYAQDGKHEVIPDLPIGIKIVEMALLDGFSLIDWCSVIEGAFEIHTANTSLLYILEILPLTMPIHFYRRNLWGEQAFEHTDYLYTKPYILH